MGRFRGVELAELTLSGERLDLRRWRPDDADRVHEIMQDPTMREHLPLPDPYPHERARLFVADLGHKGRDEGAGLGSAVVERATGRVVGSAALLLDGPADIAYWIAPDARGHGYAAEATGLLADWAFSTIGLHRIGLACHVGNTGSLRTAMAAGFLFEGVARGASAYEVGDLARFGRLADDPGEPIAPAFPPLPGGELSDGVLALRPAVLDDATGFHESDDEVSVRWSFAGERRTLAECERRMNQAALDWLVGRSAQCTIVDVATGHYVGELQVRFGGPPGVVGVGYTVHPTFRGRGYTTRALKLVVPWVFDVAGFARIELGAKRDNVASQRAAISAGFGPDGVRERRLRDADGTFADEVCFVLINPRYR
ncbi:GNAT family N-acetyltransferase [uncultured Jatrophihabitans sp.]|uniref:GNAT family N-acetyltransferase n=1 Tax=uncultured Jatrophihabitans sp. TaxID=1610747 RepID=UPI0035CB13C6